LKKVAHSIVEAIAKILNIDPKLTSDKYAVQVLRMNYYPPCMSMPEKVLGFSPHSDGSFLTILLQVNSVEGLQIKRHDAWIPVKPHPEALLVNVGDFLEVKTNFQLLSTNMQFKTIISQQIKWHHRIYGALGIHNKY
jgi:isopenicillin N synthase-like dioxygenase